MGFVFSPSNIMTYRTCPRRFMGQSITKEIKWKASTQKSRGTVVHSAIEKAMQDGMQAVRSWDTQLDTGYVQQLVSNVRNAAAKGAKVCIEHELVVTDKMKHTYNWWDDNAFLRARADALILYPDDTAPWLIDIKTGKKWDTDDFQLRVEALLVHLIYKKNIVRYSYEYVDSGESVKGIVDMTNGLLPVQDVVDTIRDMKASIRDGYFPCQSNKFCRFCDFHKTKSCDVI